MLQSLEYAGLTALRAHTTQEQYAQDDEDLLAWTWVLVDAARSTFLEAYAIVAEGAAFVPPDTALAPMHFASELRTSS